MAPVIDAVLARVSECMISVDTSKAAVALAALERGAAIINDVTALRGDPAMAAVVAEHRAGVVLMHMQGEPRTMQEHPVYADVSAEVRAFFTERLAAAVAAGIPSECVAVRPRHWFRQDRGPQSGFAARTSHLDGESTAR